MLVGSEAKSVRLDGSFTHADAYRCARVRVKGKARSVKPIADMVTAVQIVRRPLVRVTLRPSRNRKRPCAGFGSQSSVGWSLHRRSRTQRLVLTSLFSISLHILPSKC